MGIEVAALRVTFGVVRKTWRRGAESNDVFTGCQPQYPDLQGYFSIDYKRLQADLVTTRHLPALTPRAHAAYSVIEEFVEGFVEGFRVEQAHIDQRWPIKQAI
jgi:hypothetical protein